MAPIGAQQILQQPATRPHPVARPSLRRRGLIAFANPPAAEANVAGLPAAARVVREAALADMAECWLDAGPDWIPSESLRSEVERLRGTMEVHFPGEVRGIPATGPLVLIAGEALPDARTLAQVGDSRRLPGLAVFVADAGDPAARTRLARNRVTAARGGDYRRRSRDIIAATGKPTDGLVSRYLNRPLSRVASGMLLRIPGFRPGHATAMTAILGVLMLASLASDGAGGLVTGALLFQAASVFDGVDGEAARATFRCSDRGAMLDSLVDAATNLAFLFGIVVNLLMRGQKTIAEFGLSGLVMLAIGLAIIGRRARASTGPFTFDGVKDRIRARGTRLGQWLIWLTMRDFLALASVVLIVLGLAAQAMIAFSVIMAGWLIVVIATGARQTAVAP